MNILQFPPIKTFIETVGKDVENYFGSERAAIVYLLPDGLWYAEGLSQWLKKKKKNVTLSSMEDDGKELQEEKVKGRMHLGMDRMRLGYGKSFATTSRKPASRSPSWNQPHRRALSKLKQQEARSPHRPPGLFSFT